jgi:DNA-binding Xre family transcriptional regulator
MSDRLEVYKRNLELYFPFIVRDAVKYEPFSNYAMVVTLTDGSKVFYDDDLHSIRNLPIDSGKLTEEQFRTEFGNRLYRMMMCKNVTQLELSERTGIPQPRISNYIRGKNIPSFYNIDKISKALGCTLDDLRYV